MRLVPNKKHPLIVELLHLDSFCTPRAINAQFGGRGITMLRLGGVLLAATGTCEYVFQGVGRRTGLEAQLNHAIALSL